MDKANFEANQVDKDDKLLKCLKNNGIMDFKCADCDKNLLVLQLTSIDGESTTVAGEGTAEVLTRVAVKCCECGGFSYVQSVSGHFHPGAPSDNMSFDIMDDDVNAPEADVLFKAWSK